MSKKWSSYKEAQLMTENWRKFVSEDAAPLEEGWKDIKDKASAEWKRWSKPPGQVPDPLVHQGDRPTDVGTRAGHAVDQLDEFYEKVISDWKAQDKDLVPDERGFMAYMPLKDFQQEHIVDNSMLIQAQIDDPDDVLGWRAEGSSDVPSGGHGWSHVPNLAIVKVHGVVYLAARPPK